MRTVHTHDKTHSSPVWTTLYIITCSYFWKALLGLNCKAEVVWVTNTGCGGGGAPFLDPRLDVGGGTIFRVGSYRQSLQVKSGIRGRRLCDHLVEPANNSLKRPLKEQWWRFLSTMFRKRL